MRCFHASKIPKIDDQGNVEHVVCTATDITDLKSTQRALQEEREQFLSLLEGIDSPIYVADMESHEILFANSEMVKLLGEIIGKPCYEATKGRDGPCDFCTNDIIWKMAPEPYKWKFYNPLVGRHYSLTDRMIRWPDGRQVRFEIAFDINEGKRAEDALQCANEKLNLLFKVTRHDIMNQLTVIQGHLDLMKETPSLDQVEARLDRVNDAVGRIMTRLQFAREIEALGSEPAKWMPVHEPIWRVISDLRSEDIGMVVDESLERFMIYSDTLIWKVFYNLVHNTLKHANGATIIRMWLEECDGHLHIIYEDDGPGIPDGKRGSIFECCSGNGSGYRLYLIKEILSMNHMGIWEEGESGVRFVIDVPPSRFTQTRPRE